MTYLKLIFSFVDSFYFIMNFLLIAVQICLFGCLGYVTIWFLDHMRKINKEISEVQETIESGNYVLITPEASDSKNRIIELTQQPWADCWSNAFHLYETHVLNEHLNDGTTYFVDQDGDVRGVFSRGNFYFYDGILKNELHKE